LLDFLFDVTDVSFDVSRSNGTSPGVGLSVTAYLDGVVVDSTLITFGDINQWTTMSLDGVFDQIEYHAVSGTSSGSFGVDNLSSILVSSRLRDPDQEQWCGAGCRENPLPTQGFFVAETLPAGMGFQAKWCRFSLLTCSKPA